VKRTNDLIIEMLRTPGENVRKGSAIHTASKHVSYNRNITGCSVL
jgi:hypothetical protein